MTGKEISSGLLAPVPHKGPRSIELDFVRGVAILLVMGLHFLSAPTTNAFLLMIQYPGKKFGGTGVDLFFVLSGFLVGGLLMKEYKLTSSLDVRRFIFRRGMKIWPAYYLFIVLQVANHSHPLKSFLWQNTLHVQNYAGTAISHTWSLAVEEHFYLALAFGMGWMVKRGWGPERILKVLAILMCVALISRTISYFAFGIHAAFEFTHNRLDSLACGVVLALIFHFYPDTFKAIAKPWYILLAIVSAVVWFLCTVEAQAIRQTIGYTILYIGSAAFLLLVQNHSHRFRANVVYRVVAWIGVYSYGIYLYHISVRNISLKLSKDFSPALQAPALLLLQYGLAILLGMVMTRLVEWPFLRYRDRILPQKVNDIGSPDDQNSQKVDPALKYAGQISSDA